MSADAILPPQPDLGELGRSLMDEGAVSLCEWAHEEDVHPRTHPNGFIQLDLDPDRKTRLHIWHSKLPRQKVRTSIHDHIFDMESAVLKGEMRNHKFDVRLNSAGEYAVHQAREIQCTETNLFPTGQRVDLIPREVQTIKAGWTYFFPAFEFHDSDADDWTITLIRKDKMHLGTASVLVATDIDPDNEFVRADALPEWVLWDYIKAAFVL